jgi:hypothetical protein
MGEVGCKLLERQDKVIQGFPAMSGTLVYFHHQDNHGLYEFTLSKDITSDTHSFKKGDRVVISRDGSIYLHK